MKIYMLAVNQSLSILPILNHVGIFIVIRLHNNQVTGAVSGPNASSIIFRREKTAAIDMIIVIAVLLLCLCPNMAVTHQSDSNKNKWCKSAVCFA